MIRVMVSDRVSALDRVYVATMSDNIPVKVYHHIGKVFTCEIYWNLKQKHRPIKDNAYRQDLVSVHRKEC